MGGMVAEFTVERNFHDLSSIKGKRLYICVHCSHFLMVMVHSGMSIQFSNAPTRKFHHPVLSDII